MSTVAPPAVNPTTQQPPQNAPTRSPAESLIEQRISEAQSALWWAELIRNGLFFVIVVLSALLIWVLMDHWIYAPGFFIRSIAFIGLVGWAVWFSVRRLYPVVSQRVTREYAARSLEKELPELKQQLTSYVTLKSDAASSGLRRRVMSVIGSRAAGKLQTHDALPAEATGTFKWWIAALAVFAVVVGYAVMSPKNSLASASRLLAPFANIEPARRVAISDVQPGDVEALAGRYGRGQRGRRRTTRRRARHLSN